MRVTEFDATLKSTGLHKSLGVSEKFEFSRQTFKIPQIPDFIKISLSESRVVSCGRADGRTDKHNEVNSHFPQFFERAKMIKLFKFF
jgi:hypothetical protein